MYVSIKQGYSVFTVQLATDPQAKSLQPNLTHIGLTIGRGAPDLKHLLEIL